MKINWKFRTMWELNKSKFLWSQQKNLEKNFEFGDCLMVSQRRKNTYGQIQE